MNIIKNGEELRCGYTTGSCATAVATCATEMLLTQKLIAKSTIILPNSQRIEFEIVDSNFNLHMAECAVIKDAGDDPDVTNGAKICARVKLTKSKINIFGGIGVGVVTQEGLQCEVGQSAINPTPRKMIEQNVRETLEKHNYCGGIDVEIFVPDGERIAKQTYNSRLGIMGGISILGTTGIVEPMSENALIDTIKLMIDKQYLIDSKNILISPGNYGESFSKDFLRLDINKTVKISNYIGQAFDYIKYKGFENILLVGHLGKIIKLAGGVMNTHSNMADCRMEIIASHASVCGGDGALASEIMDCVNTDKAFALIKNYDFYDKVVESIGRKIKYHASYRLKEQVNFEFIVFGTDYTNVIKSENADEMIKYFLEE